MVIAVFHIITIKYFLNIIMLGKGNSFGLLIASDGIT